MHTRVDARRQVVWRGEERWPFDVDCRDAIARIAIAEQRFEVRALSWREKRNLAHFAHLGEKFLEQQFSRLCCGYTPSSEAGARDDVLLALAMWVNEPGPESALPFNTEVLSRALVDLCRSTGLGPDVFDDRPAHEVEALWRTTQDHADEPWGARGRRASGASMDAVHSEVTRIIVTPDAAVQPEGPGPAQPEAVAGSDATPATHSMPQADAMASPPAVADEATVGDDSQAGPAAASQPPTPIEPPRHTRSRAPEPRFRVLFPVAAGSQARRSKPADSQPTAIAAVTPAWRHEGRVQAMRQPASQPEPLQTPLPEPPLPQPQRSHVAAASHEAPIARSTPAVPQAEPAAPIDVLEDLADRLEEAAEELGIDIHS